MTDTSVDLIEEIKPPYFAISLTKLVLLSVSTLGLYQVWWHYVNWCRVRANGEHDIRPAWRAVFCGLWCYPLLSNIRSAARELELDFWLPAGPLTIIWLITAALSRLPGIYGMAFLLAVLWLIPAQIVANRINAKIAPGHDPNQRFRGWEIAIVVVGMLFLALAAVGFSLPPLES